MNDANHADNRGPARWRRWLLVGLPVLLVGGVLVTTQAQAFGRPWGRHGLSGEHMEQMIDKRVERALSEVGATDDQKARIKATLARTKPELKALAEKRAKLREAAGKALAADRVDSGEIERLRQETMRLAESGSTLLSRTLLEVAQVLQPAQRRELLEHWQGRGGPF